MALHEISREELQNVIAKLEQATYNHQQWYNLLVRTLICRLDGDRHDESAQAHKECRFGQWYYNSAPKELLDHPGFIALGKEHKSMHQAAAKLLLAAKTGQSLAPHDYDNLANLIDRLRLELAGLSRELEELLYNRDPLTDTISRVNLLPILREKHELVKREVETCCIVMLDFDDFKKVNDKYGHSIGDRVLSQTAHYIMKSIRTYDKVFRYGGEEFLICIPAITTEAASEMLERIRKGISEMPIDAGKKTPIYITVSFGATYLDPNVEVEDSIIQADQALYESKKTGKNKITFWEERISEATDEN